MTDIKSKKINQFERFIKKFAQSGVFDDYDKQDHSHCWESKNPPCGIKGEHRCCLCGTPVPDKQKATP